MKGIGEKRWKGRKEEAHHLETQPRRHCRPPRLHLHCHPVSTRTKLRRGREGGKGVGRLRAMVSVSNRHGSGKCQYMFKFPSTKASSPSRPVKLNLIHCHRRIKQKIGATAAVADRSRNGRVTFGEGGGTMRNGWVKIGRRSTKWRAVRASR